MLTLYFAKNTIALATMIAMAEAKLDYEAVEISFADSEQQSSKYKQINPKGRVPALVTEHGILTETPALLTYVAECAPSSNIGLPHDAFERARINALNSYLGSTVHVAHAHRMRGSRWADDPKAWESMQAKVPESVTQAMLLIENDLEEGKWSMGERYSICDPYLFTISQWLEGDKADLGKLPKVMAHANRMKEREAVKTALKLQAGEG